MTDKKPLKVYKGKLTDFAQDPANPNAGSPRGNALIKLSLREYGAGKLAHFRQALIHNNHSPC